MTRDNKRTLRRGILLAAMIIAFIAFSLITITISGCTSQKTSKIYKIGILCGAEQFCTTTEGFKSEMTELGYIENKNIVYDINIINADPARDEQAFKKFIDDKVDLIFAFPTEAAAEARAITKDTGIPILFAWTTTEGTNVADSVTRPGKDITGIRMSTEDLMLRRFEMLHQLAPGVKNVWVIYDPRIIAATDSLKVMRPYASSVGMNIVETQISSVDDVRFAILNRSGQEDIGVDAVFLMPDANTNAPEGFGLLMKFSQEHRLPVSALMEWQVSAGALYTYTPDPTVTGNLAASLADKILKGTPAGDMAVVTIDGSFWINYNVTQELGLNVSEGMFVQANKIIR